MRDKEIGLVIEKNKKGVTIELIPSSACESCGAKALCNTTESGRKIIKAVTDVEVNVGDSVEIEQIGKNILKISLLQYGIPLALFLITVIPIYYLMENNLSSGIPELIAFLSGCTVVVISGFLIRAIFSKISLKGPLTFRVVKIVQKAQEK